MRVRVFDSDDEVGEAVAWRMAGVVHDHAEPVLGLATGRTPLAAYARLKAMCVDGRLDFSRTHTFNLDEFVGVPPSHRGSFRHFMATHLFAGLNLDAARVHFLNGVAPDLDAECERYEADLHAAGGAHVQLLGLGVNGHIGFNEPADALLSRTHRVVLHDVTRRENAGQFDGNTEAVPREALTMGMGTIFSARTLVMAVTGVPKATSVERMIHGPVTTHLPASFLQMHGDVEVYLDREAASRL